MIATTANDARVQNLMATANASSASTLLGSKPGAAASPQKLRAQAEDFESVFVSTMFQSMFTGIEGDGPMGTTAGVGPWRSFLTQEYAKNFVKAGGLGLADSVYKSLLAQQEAKTKPSVSQQGLQP